MRVGAWEYLKFSDIEVIIGVDRGTLRTESFLAWIDDDKEAFGARIVVYAGTPDEYVTFGTPEFLHKLKEYVIFRKKSGENITLSSPVMRNVFPTVTEYIKYGIPNEYTKKPASRKISALTSIGISHLVLNWATTKGIKTSILHTNTDAYAAAIAGLIALKHKLQRFAYA